MQKASRAYKQQMEQYLRNHSYCVVTIGAINQLAQANASISSEMSYLSNNTLLFDGYSPEIRYATMEQDWLVCDGSMYFPQRPASATYIYNQGAISENILGAITFVFNTSYDIKGLTIEFGRNYPTDFTITNGSDTYTYSGNDNQKFICDDVFNDTSLITITPTAMVNGNDRMRIELIYFGVGIQFTNKKLLNVDKRETMSPISAELPTIDLSVSVENYDKVWNVNNSSSSINYLEMGQEVNVSYGYELNDSSIYWIDGTVCDLVSWKANDQQMSFEAQDKIASLTEIYYGGEYYSNGISLYDLAILVLTDAEVDVRMYSIDSYLEDVIVYNPLPAVSHAECLQIIANAGRCKLYTDRSGRICISPSFETELNPERMTITSDDATPFSNLHSVITQGSQIDYAMMTEDYLLADSSMYFLPRDSSYLTTGFVSNQVSNSSGTFTTNPKVTVGLEAAATFFSLNLQFSANAPSEVIIHSYLEGVLQESYTATQDFNTETTIDHEFPRMDEFVIEFVETEPNNRIYLTSISFGAQTDYKFTKAVMTSAPTGERSGKVKEVQIIKSAYSEGQELQTIASDTVDLTDIGIYTFYLSAPAHGFSAIIDGTTALTVYDASAYFVSLDTSLYSGEHEIQVNGYSYVVSESIYSNQINTTGTIEQWSNPLVSNDTLASLLAEWIGDFYKNNAVYDISYRGEPRLDVGDYAFLDDEYISNMVVQIMSHDLNFNGALSGTVTARLATGGDDSWQETQMRLMSRWITNGNQRLRSTQVLSPTSEVQKQKS